MHGLPAILKTRDDFEHALGEAKQGRLSPSAVRAHFQGLLDTQQHYVFDRVLAAAEPADGAGPAFVVHEEQNTDGTTTRRQFRLMPDPNSRLHKVGYTASEVQQKLTELEGL